MVECVYSMMETHKCFDVRIFKAKPYRGPRENGGSPWDAMKRESKSSL